MPLQPLPKPQERNRVISDQCQAWLDAPERTEAERQAFWEASEHLKHSEWGPVRLASSLVYTDYFHAETATGHLLLVRFGMSPPVAAVFLTYVGDPVDVANFDPREPGTSG